MNRRAPRSVWMFTLLAGALVCACGQDEGQPSVAGGQALHTDVGEQIGPQPGAEIPVRPVSNPYRGDEALVEGRRLYTWYNCAGCHGPHGGGGMGPSLRDEAWIYGDSDADIFNSIAQGRAHGMPAWGGRLPREEIWKIVAFIQSMRTPREPSPPPANPVYPGAPR